MSTNIELINKVISDHLGVKLADVLPEKSIVDDLGADSLDKVELVMAFEEEFDLNISDEDSEPLHTVGDFHQYIQTAIDKDIKAKCYA